MAMLRPTIQSSINSMVSLMNDTELLNSTVRISIGTLLKYRTRQNGTFQPQKLDPTRRRLGVVMEMLKFRCCFAKGKYKTYLHKNTNHT